ncbi:ATP-binding cassette domain-containing protein [Marinilabiliaceae bacterium JC017]|nr:ATP-binding cassette domain-containing protein [Marinilabiliaceae bacterium JC017]
MNILIERKVLVSMFFIALTMLGVISYRQLSFELLPNTEYPMLFVQVLSSTETDPAYVEKEAIVPMEGVVAGLEGVEKIESRVNPGRGMIMVYLNKNVSVKYSYLKLVEKVESARNLLPEDFRAEVMRVDMEQFTNKFIQLQVRGEGGVDRVRNIVDQEIKGKLESIDGIAGVEVFGGRQKSVEITIDENVLKSHNLTLGGIRQKITSGQNARVFAGEVIDGTTRYYVAAEADYNNIRDIGNIVVKPEGPVLLNDIAVIRFGVKEDESYSRVNGKESVTLTLAKEAQVNMIDLSRKVLKEIDRLNASYQDKGVELVVETNEAETMETNLDQIIFLALVGGALAIFILWIFLKNVPLVTIVMLSLPISVYGAFNFFYSAGISINVLTLVGLALAIGMLIDNSVVVLENIYQVASSGRFSSRESVVKGTKEVWRSVIAATLTTVSIFVPFVFSSNVFFREMARHISVSIVSTLIVSLVVALILIPMLTHLFLSRVIKDRIHALEKLSLHNRLVQGYILLLKTTLRRPAQTILIALVLFFSVLLISAGLNIAGQQETETTEFMLSLEMPSGSTLSTTDKVVREIEKRLADLAEKKDVISQVYEQEANITVRLDKNYKQIDGRSIPEIKQDIQGRIANIEGGEINLSQSSTTDNDGGFGTNPGLGMMGFLGVGQQNEKVVITGENYDQMLLVANDIKYYLENNIENLQRVSISTAMPRPEVHLDMDAYLMGMHGINPATVASELFTFRPEVSSGGKLKVNNEEYDILLKTNTASEAINTSKTMDDLEKLQVRGAQNALFPLKDFSEINYARGRSEIQRVNQQKQIEVIYRFSEEVKSDGTLLEESRQAVDDLVASVPLTADVAVKVIHQEDIYEEYKFLALVGLVLIFMILASVFESLAAPVVMMFSIPLAAIGSLLALVFTGNSLLNPNTFIGYLILLGVVVNNGILLIDYSRQLRKQGYNHIRALVEAGISRIRPVLITATTTIVAMVPLAMGKSEFVGSLGAPFAITVIGGLSFCTLLTLVFIPTFGFGFERALDWIRALPLKLKLLVFSGWGIGYTWLYFYSNSGFIWQMLLVVLITVGVPAVLYFVLTSLKMAQSKLIAPDELITINIRNLVKVYGRDTRFVREWKSREKMAGRRENVNAGNKKQFVEGLIWQLPLLGFVIYFTWWYLDNDFWLLIFTVINYFIFQSFLGHLFPNRGGETVIKKTEAKVTWYNRIRGGVYWGYPLIGMTFILLRWDSKIGGVIITLLWYLVLLLIESGKKLKREGVNIERITGRFTSLRKPYYRLLQQLPFIGKEKQPFKALKGVSLQINTGMIGLLGPNGAGKTTLMRIICGILDQSYGKVFINGFDTTEKREELQGLIGYLPQEFGTYENMSAYEFLDYQAILRHITDTEVRQGRVKYVLEAVNMWEKKDNKIGSFSGGMKQRIGIAMILLHLPKILVVDEPTAGLDPRERIRFRNLLVELSRERIVLFSTHIIEDISSSCNQVAVLNRGELKYWGKPGEMVNIARNKVWQFDVGIDEFASLNGRLKVVHHMRDGNKIRVRCLSREQPVENARLVMPVLEDAYIWLLGKAVIDETV